MHMEPDRDVLLTVRPSSRRRLVGTRRWMRFVGAVVALAGAACVVLALQVGLTGLARSDGTRLASSAVVLLVGVLYFLLTVFLLRVAGAAERFARLGEETSFERFLHHQHRLWRFVGIAAAGLIAVVALVASLVLTAFLHVFRSAPPP